MQMIIPQIERAFRVNDPLSEDRALSELLGSMLERAGFGLILVTADRRIVYANDTAETLMRRSNGLRCERNCVNAADFTASRKLRSLITAASRQADEKMRSGSLLYRDEDGMASLIVHVVPLRTNSSVGPADKECPVAGLAIVDCQQGVADRISAFADLFALTAGEGRVAAQLVSGAGLRKAASCLNIALSTARSHLKHILEKTGTHRQAELVRVFYETTIPWRGRRRTVDHRPIAADTSRHLGSC
jgi:DNA-binding CsgD family transcriptional regulator